MADNLIQIGVKVDITELQAALQQAKRGQQRLRLALADKDVVEIGKDIDRILAGKKIGTLSEDLQNDLKNLDHFTFEKLDEKIKNVGEAIQKAQGRVQALETEIQNARETPTQRSPDR